MFDLMEEITIFGAARASRFKIKRNRGHINFGPFFIDDSNIHGNFYIQKIEKHLHPKFSDIRTYTTFLFRSSRYVKTFINILDIENLLVEFHFDIEKIVKLCCFSMYDDYIEKYLFPKLKQNNFGIFL